LTAYADEDTLKKATLAEPFGYLIKPFDEKELLVAIELAFYKHQVETESNEKRRWLNAILSSITDGLVPPTGRVSSTSSTRWQKDFSEDALRLQSVSR